MNSNPKGKQEFYRKIFHIISISLWIVPIKFLPQYLTVFLFFAVILINFALTQKYQWFLLKPLYILVEYIERSKNMHSPGIQGLWANIGIFITYLIFDENVVILSILILAVCDGLSGIIGYYLGKMQVPLSSGKTVEGTFTFLIFSFILSFIFFDFKTAFVVSLITTAVELFINFPDDNMTIPLSVGISCYIAQFV